MKPTSIIFLIISIILACVGVLLCMTAQDMANDQGIALFKQEKDGNNNFVETFDEIDEESLQKLSVSAGDAEVNIIGGADKSRIELVNFSDGSYSITAGKTQITISGIEGIAGLINLDSFKINFDGFRNYQNYFKYRSLPKTVNIYLTDAAAVRFVEVKTANGSVSIKNLKSNCDYRLSTEKGSVSLLDITTGSTVTIDSKKELTALLTGVSAHELMLSAEAVGNVTVKDSTFAHKIDATVKSGEFTYCRPEGNFNDFNVELNAPAGKITVFGKEYDKKFTEQNVEVSLRPITPETTEPAESSAETGEAEAPADEASEINTISITVKSGNITILKEDKSGKTDTTENANGN